MAVLTNKLKHWGGGGGSLCLPGQARPWPGLSDDSHDSRVTGTVTSVLLSMGTPLDLGLPTTVSKSDTGGAAFPVCNHKCGKSFGSSPRSLLHSLRERP
jgi:hypothetical protein